MIIIESNVVFFSLFAEIEAKEACDWLRAAGFPQYAQLFKGKYETVQSTPRYQSVTPDAVLLCHSSCLCFRLQIPH